jgi:hypothetical protein
MTLCPDCLAKNIVATVDGPTCSHRPPGPWWPDWWGTVSEERRCAWLRARTLAPTTAR